MIGLFNSHRPLAPSLFTETVNGHLTKIAGAAFVRDAERTSIAKSITYLQGRLRTYFGRDIKDQFLFGSYPRGTILPRCMDSESDIDYMVVFNDDEAQPQTYLNRLRRFVENTYQRSVVKQSHPTIQLELNHIRFELVPSLPAFWSEFKIPAPASDFTDWMTTNPGRFNSTLTDLNKAHSNHIKPTIRILKYWNAQSGYPFESYELEKCVVASDFSCYSFCGDLKSHVYEVVDGFSTWGATQRRREAIQSLKTKIDTIRKLENTGKLSEAVNRMKLLFPLIV